MSRALWPIAASGHDSVTFLEAGNNEGTKALWHSAGLVLFAGCFLYNTAAFIQRRERHLLLNAIGYGLGTYYEWLSVRHHLEQRG